MFQRTKSISLWALLLFSIQLIQSCSTNPVTGKSELSFYSRSQQIQMGVQNYTPGQQSQGGVYYLDPALNDYVNAVGQKLAEVSDVPDLPYEFVVLNNGVPNAWALPGGKIAINRGLLTELEDESELAAVLSHEIVHAAAGHGASQMSRGVLFGLGTTVAAVAGTQTDYGNLINLGSQVGAAAWSASYGRDDELESDEYGMLYMSRAGYDVQGAVELQKAFVELSGSAQQDFISGLFASHPPSQSRVNANVATARKFPAGGIKNRAAYEKATSQLRKDQIAYEAESFAIEALNKKNATEALEQLDVAVSIQPDEGQFWELRGHAWQMKNDNDNALKAFSTAIRKNENYYQHWLARGLLRKEMGQANAAEQDIQRSHDLLPNSVSAYHLGELVEARGDISAARSYYSQAASAGGALGSEAQTKLIRYDLPESPNKYIASGFFLSTKGELIAAVENQSGLEVSGIRVRVTSRANGNSRDYRIRGSLDNGQQANTNTGIYGQPSDYNIVVISAAAN